MVPKDRGWSRPSLLLVDDCACERDLYELILETEFRVLTAARGDECCEVATLSRPDAIVLDVMMPGMDGWETCRHIKDDARTAGIPVILLTGADDGDLSARAEAAGAEVLLTKPCPADRLSETIRRTLAERRAKAVWGIKH